MSNKGNLRAVTKRTTIGLLGPAGGEAYQYTYDPGTANSYPGDGKMRFNNIAATSVTRLYVSAVDANGAVNNRFADLVVPGTFPVSRVRVYSRSQPALQFTGRAILGGNTFLSPSYYEIIIDSGQGVSVGYVSTVGDIEIAISDIGPPGPKLVNYLKRKITAGNYTLNNTAWTAVDTTNLKFSIAASAGDVLEAAFSGFTDNAATDVYFDMENLTAATWWGASGGVGDQGHMAWRGTSGVFASTGAPAYYTVQSSDIAAGLVSCQLMFRTSNAVNKSLFATAAVPLEFVITNLGSGVGGVGILAPVDGKWYYITAPNWK